MLKVGIIGCGSITVWRHAPEYHNNPNSEITMFYDAVELRAKELANQYNSSWCSDYKEIINNPEIDAVSICTPNETHAKLTIEALNAGKHVLCEKPMAISIEDAVLMQKVANENNCKLMIGLSQRYFITHQKAKEILTTGLLGRVISFRGAFKNHGPDFWSVDKNKNNWFFDKKKSGAGALGDLGVHKIDLLTWLISDDIEYVNATNVTLDKKDDLGNFVDVIDNSFCTLTTKSGIVGTIEASWSCYGNCENSLIIYCENAIMYLSPEEQDDIVIVMKDEMPIRISTKANKSQSELSNSGIIDEFISSVMENREVAISGFDGIKTISIINACVESSQKEGIRTKVKSINELLNIS